MKNTFKYTFRFIEINSRLGMRKHRSKTLELDRELFDHYNVDGMMKAFNSVKSKFTFDDSNVIIKTIKVGRTEFQM